MLARSIKLIRYRIRSMGTSLQSTFRRTFLRCASVKLARKFASSAVIRLSRTCSWNCELPFSAPMPSWSDPLSAAFEVLGAMIDMRNNCELKQGDLSSLESEEAYSLSLQNGVGGLYICMHCAPVHGATNRLGAAGSRHLYHLDMPISKEVPGKPRGWRFTCLWILSESSPHCGGSTIWGKAWQTRGT